MAKGSNVGKVNSTKGGVGLSAPSMNTATNDDRVIGVHKCVLAVLVGLVSTRVTASTRRWQRSEMQVSSNVPDCKAWRTAVTSTSARNGKSNGGKNFLSNPDSSRSDETALRSFAPKAQLAPGSRREIVLERSILFLKWLVSEAHSSEKF